MNPNKKMPKLFSLYTCEKCDFTCSKHSNYLKHISTRKHEILTNPNNFDAKKKSKIYQCQICNKIYKHASTLSSHKKICKFTDIICPIQHSESDIKILTNLVLEVVKSNQSLQQQVLDVCKNGVNTTNNNNINNNSHNKTFNLNFFLNEQCKDAMNIMDFVNTIQLKVSDMERIGELGYVEGISNIIMENLNGMDIYKRPIHCSDAKRETMHIKDKGIWEKDTINNDKMRKAIKHITWLNSKLLFAWAAEHPGVVYSDHKLNDKYCEMVVEAMGGKRNKTMEEGEAKIIKKISKLVLIDKTNL